MPFQDAMKSIQELTRNAETLAALGAILSAKAGAGAANDAVSTKLSAVQAAIDPALFDGLSGEEARFLHATVLANLRRVVSLVEAPDQPARWATDDPVILQAQGKSSRIVTRLITEFAGRESSLSERLNQISRFLDVGSGAGWISISMAEQWPALSVDGLDIHPPALSLAEHNLEAAGLADRITFHNRSVDALTEVAAYTAAFIPFIFIPEPVIDAALPALNRAIEAGGWLFVAGYRVPDAPLMRALIDLQTTLSGGRIWSEGEIGARLSRNGFEVIEDIGTDSPINLFAARKA
jgi:SAM-dependent methyltransferase